VQDHAQGHAPDIPVVPRPPGPAVQRFQHAKLEAQHLQQVLSGEQPAQFVQAPFHHLRREAYHFGQMTDGQAARAVVRVAPEPANPIQKVQDVPDFDRGQDAAGGLGPVQNLVHEGQVGSL